MNITTETSLEAIQKQTYYEWSENFLLWCRFWIPNVLAPIIFVMGVVGNVTTIIVLTRKRMTGSTNVYLTALAAADLLFLIIYLSVVFENEEELHSPDYLFYWEYWRFGLWLLDAIGGVSTWLTVSFTLERYIAVCHPLRGKVLCTESRARKVVVGVVISCFLVTITTPFEWVIENRLDPSTNRTEFVHYSSLGTNELYQDIFYWFTSIVFVFIPLLVLMVLNYYLIQAVRKSNKKRKTLTQMTSRKMYREKQENKITTALVAVVFFFLICQAPTAITLIVSTFYKPDKKSVGDNVLRALGNIWNFLVAVYAACNFLLYCAMSDKYRQTMYRTFCPSLAYSHERANTYSSTASFRNSSMHR